MGLWTTSLGEMHRFVKDPTGILSPDTYDIEVGMEDKRHYQAAESRFYQLAAATAKTIVPTLIKASSWRYTHTCASWASEMVRAATGENLSAAELGGLTDTPRKPRRRDRPGE